ncbi:hypothetical protein THASP1DRAFT_32836 [Thamnocephalis sphaerospora]|uniref:F-box domain-containing protein n=1 Tax=Thamnocephalis sphaerospora TaxID=78915 RepID=A0A4P9XHY5_9FUNG|nr:hypothetical protein THASP1DRAFT_32836 [Thamnocephalis sphaerospora]|eukprot:RKP05323.1 hypothetical protein THASP1DRAFT_32836 [Thamnocephalis sphaerospora]
MNRVPAEIVYRIVYVSEDEAALVALAATSRWLYACVAAQRKLWRLCFERDFPKQDENERRWLQLYARTHLADLLFAKKRQTVLLPTEELLDWFRVYCNRRATEYRWRHGLYTTQQPEQAASTHAGGIRLQSIILSQRMIQDIRVVSQRILAPQQRPIWVTEQPCWDGVDADGMFAAEGQCSDEYLVIAVEPPGMLMLGGSTNSTLYVWHLNAFHLPPRLIMNKHTGFIRLYKNWLVVRKYFMSGTPGITFVFDLAKHTTRPGIIEGGASRIIIQKATENSIRLLCRNEVRQEESHARVSWRLWDVMPGREPPTRCLTVCETQFYADDSHLQTRRIDDSRFVMYNIAFWHHSVENRPPTIVLMEITESNAGVAIKEKWSLVQELNNVEPIVSRDLLLVTVPLKGHRLLNLSDGSLVRDISIATLDCWSKSGLYPLRSRWTNVTEAARDHLKGDPTLTSDGLKTWSASSNARMVTANDAPAIADYSI